MNTPSNNGEGATPLHKIKKTMTQEAIKIGQHKDIDSFRLIADEGKVLQRKSDGAIFGNEITLGYTWYINGTKLSEPHFEVPSDYQEIDAPVEEDVEQINEENYEEGN